MRKALHNKEDAGQTFGDLDNAWSQTEVPSQQTLKLVIPPSLFSLFGKNTPDLRPYHKLSH